MSFQVIINSFQQCWLVTIVNCLSSQGLHSDNYFVSEDWDWEESLRCGKGEGLKIEGKATHQSEHELPPHSYESDRSAFILETFSPLRNVMDTHCGISENTDIQKKRAFRASPSPDSEAPTLQLCRHVFKMICSIMYMK